MKRVMRHTDVTEDTPVEVRQEFDVTMVDAIRPCGCSGPWLGYLQEIEPAYWNTEMRGIVAESPVSGHLWAVFPVRHGNRYETLRTPIAFVVGRRRAAAALRDFIARRNVRNRSTGLVV